MREIEKEILREIAFGCNNQIDKSFSVRDRLKREGYNAYKYYLWEHNIFTRDVNYIQFSMCGYGTQTTKQRINVFLDHELHGSVYIYRKDWKYYLHINGNTVEIAEDKTYRINLETQEMETI